MKLKAISRTLIAFIILSMTLSQTTKGQNISNELLTALIDTGIRYERIKIAYIESRKENALYVDLSSKLKIENATILRNCDQKTQNLEHAISHKDKIIRRERLAFVGSIILILILL